MSHEPVPLLDLERWALGDMPTDEIERLEALAAADPELDARMTRVQEAIRDAAIGLPVFVIPEEQPEPANRPGWPMFAGIGTLLAAAVALWVVLPSPPPTTTWRGAALDLEVFRIRDGQAQRQGALVAAREGDRLQYSVATKEDGYISVFDVQDDGEISQWMAPTRSAAGQSVAGAVQLDGYAGAERVFFIASPEPVTLEQIREAVSDGSLKPLADLDELPGLAGAQRSILVVDE